MRAMTSLFFPSSSLMGFLVLGLAFAILSPAKAEERDVTVVVEIGRAHV